MKKSKNKNKTWFALSVMIAGLITLNVGNDAGKIITYSFMGAKFGYSMLFVLLLLFISLSVIQETNGRMAVVTGKGLGDLIREWYGVRPAFLAIIVLFVTNFAVCIGNFAGIAIALKLLGVSQYISIPLILIIIWFVVVKGYYNKVEKILFIFSIGLIAYVAAMFKANVNWSVVVKHTFYPHFLFQGKYILAIIAMIGATIPPHMQLYLQSCVVERGVDIDEYKYEKFDIYFGTFISFIISFSILVCSAVVLGKGNVFNIRSLVTVLNNLLGGNLNIIFALVLLAISIAAGVTAPLSTTSAVCESFGIERGMENSYKEAPIFYGIFTFIVVISAIFILIPNLPLTKIVIMSQQIVGLLTPIMLIYIYIVSNNKEIMGEHVNNTVQNIILWFTISASIIVIILLIVYTGLNLIC
ncbi:NRAMP family divalent metal transporter [Clostridium rectalis]|uniref:NRAMP family divalent metal transporter n=1 Tax=Clostridium rectalis TaxID=2040295 RepID=UPI000F634EC0|nr:divalent metal cation transporter [Clostridium rectalis]